MRPDRRPTPRQDDRNRTGGMGQGQKRDDQDVDRELQGDEGRGTDREREGGKDQGGRGGDRGRTGGGNNR
jgi:hypothetical protein